jgi:type II secretory pathway pseudopilin PulG
VIVLVVVGIALAAFAAVWLSRTVLARRDQRSIEGYERTLNLLGDVSRRGANAGHRLPANSSGQRPIARIDPAELRFDDLAAAYDARVMEAPEPLVLDKVPSASTVADPEGTGPPRSRRVGPRRAGALGVVAVVLAGAVAVGWELASSSPGGPRRAVTAGAPGRGNAGGHRHGRIGGGAPVTTIVSPTTQPSSLAPLSANPTEVAYRLPPGNYTLQFHATGVCWLGIQSVPGGPWVWQTTLSAGDSTSYSGGGPILVRVGAPPYLESMDVDGIAAVLPRYSQPYEISFGSS